MLHHDSYVSQPPLQLGDLLGKVKTQFMLLRFQPSNRLVQLID
jgi:hypothetical protein